MLFEEMDYDDSDRRIWEAVYVKVYAKKKIGEKFDRKKKSLYMRS